MTKTVFYLLMILIALLLFSSDACGQDTIEINSNFLYVPENTEIIITYDAFILEYQYFKYTFQIPASLNLSYQKELAVANKQIDILNEKVKTSEETSTVQLKLWKSRYRKSLIVASIGIVVGITGIVIALSD